jgi:aminomethyltransferase
MTEGQSKVKSLSAIIKEIFLNDYHKYNHAKFTSFCGYSMPINYDLGIIKEHLHVRSSVGIFDVSHMGQILIPTSISNIIKLEKFVPLNLKNLKNNKSYYSFILNPHGGVVDDIILSKILYNDKEYFFIVYNALKKKKDEEIFKNNLSDYKLLKDNSLIAIQGPLAKEILFFLPKIEELFFMNSVVVNYFDYLIIINRSGYTGEDGFEISIPNNIVFQFINKLMKNKNAKLCGLGARDSLRIEAGLCLYGNELNENISPIEANLSWAINKERLNDENLNGQKILLNQFNKGTTKNKIAFKCLSKSILRNNMKLLDIRSNEIGYITSGAFSPTLKSSIGIGYINKKLQIGNKIFTLIRNNIEELEIVQLPFVFHKYKKGK